MYIYLHILKFQYGRKVTVSIFIACFGHDEWYFSSIHHLSTHLKSTYEIFPTDYWKFRLATHNYINIFHLFNYRFGGSIHIFHWIIELSERPSGQDGIWSNNLHLPVISFGKSIFNTTDLSAWLNEPKGKRDWKTRLLF